MRTRVRIVVLGAALVAFSETTAQAQAPAEELKGLGFGAALAFQWNVLSPDRVEEALIDANGIVRVSKRRNTTATFMAEMHYFPWRKESFGTGPFVAAQPGSD